MLRSGAVYHIAACVELKEVDYLLPASGKNSVPILQQIQVIL